LESVLSVLQYNADFFSNARGVRSTPTFHSSSEGGDEKEMKESAWTVTILRDEIL